jgi:arylsulfatase A-like enzyme
MTENRPNVLIVVLDAARAENFSVLGYDRPTTPNLERWAERLALHRQCVCPATWTLPSITSLFTGTYPSTHRLVIDGDRLPGHLRSMPEVLTDAGYFTAKVTGKVPYVSEFTGLDRGFAVNHSESESELGRWRRSLAREQPGATPQVAPAPTPGGGSLDVDAFASKVEEDLRSRASLGGRFRYWLSGFSDVGAEGCFRRVRELWDQHSDQPRFVYVHLMESHAEYRPPHRFRKKFLPERLRNRTLSAINQRPNPQAAGVVEMTDEDFEVLTGLYDGCIAYLDEQLGKLLDDLSTRPDFDDTLVVVTADHGDCLGRHGVLGHQFVCYEELLHIPWIVKWPKSIGITGDRHELLQTIDLLPTLCNMLGVETPATSQGIDMLSGKREVAFGELLKPFSKAAVLQGLHELTPHLCRGVLAARSGSHKLITYSNEQADEFYDVGSDPRESRNLLGVPRDDWSPATSGAEAQLRKALEGHQPVWTEAVAEIDARIHGEGRTELSPKVAEQLRSLGYLD